MSASTKSFSLMNSQKLRERASRYDRPPTDEITETAPVPPPRNDFFRDLNLPNRIHFDNAINSIIDVVPDIRYCLIYIIYNVVKLYTQKLNHAMYTPSSTVAYCLLQLYAFLLLNDSYGRTTPSAFSAQFQNDVNRNDYFKILLGSYTPPFMKDLFHGLTDCLDPRRPGIQYVSTLAASLFSYDFGRLVPPQAFIHAHNQSTEEDTSRNVPGAIQSLLSRYIFLVNNTNYVCVGNYFSAGFADNTYSRTWMYELLRLVFAPVTGRSLVRDLFFEEIPLQCQDVITTFGDAYSDSYNPYTHFLVASTSNLVSMKRFIQRMSSVMQTELNAKFQLGAIPSELSGVNILVHGFSSLALPTWHPRQLNEDFTLKHAQSYTDYARALRFKVSMKYVPSEKHPFPTAPETIDSVLYLVDNVAHTPDLEPLKQLMFDEERDVYPRTLYLDPYTEGDGPISFSMIAGLLIESEEIDGSTVHMPNSGMPLAPNNRLFLSGSLPINVLHKAYESTSDYGRIIPRDIPRSREFTMNHDLYCVGLNLLGSYDLDSAESEQLSLPGFTRVRHVRNATDTFSKLSARVTPKRIRSNSLPDDKERHVWSPYRHILDETDTPPAESDIYVIFNTRTLFGENIPLVESRHPAEVMPSS